MTASVADKLNQPLTAMANKASAARRFLERGNIDPALLQQLLQDMVADSRRASEVIRGIRALDRPEKVFDHFFSTRQTGMGMGLTIVQSIIETHGGNMRAENPPDRGARFFFRLPAARKPQTRAA